MKRRKYLRSAVALFIPLVSGCTSSLPFSTSGKAKLGDVKVINYHSKPHTLHILVKENSKIAHWSSHRLKPLDGEGTVVSLENTWGDNGRQDTLYARRDNKNSWKKTDLSNLPEGATFDIDVGIQRDKEITFSMSPVNKNETT
jgi:hypothetical protein